MWLIIYKMNRFLSYFIWEKVMCCGGNSMYYLFNGVKEEKKFRSMRLFIVNEKLCNENIPNFCDVFVDINYVPKIILKLRWITNGKGQHWKPRKRSDSEKSAMNMLSTSPLNEPYMWSQVRSETGDLDGLFKIFSSNSLLLKVNEYFTVKLETHTEIKRLLIRFTRKWQKFNFVTMLQNALF